MSKDFPQRFDTAKDAIGFYIEQCNPDDADWQDDFIWAFNAAKLGTYPKESAFQIPPVYAWPHWAKHIELRFIGGGQSEVVSEMARPKESWLPAVGELVFVGTTAMVGRVEKIVDGKVYIKGLNYIYTAKQLAPFDSGKVGVQWSEVAK
jgi:hypothetical protein